MVEYRIFRNYDPPALHKLWHQSELGRGAAQGFSNEGFETGIFSQPYFEPEGMILAVDGSEVIGFVHAGFGCNEAQSLLDARQGVICAIVVRPDYRRKGIGSQLLELAETYLREAGTKELQAGCSPYRDPFYFGIYGGSRPSGFMESDTNADPFFKARGYFTVEQHGVYQREIAQPRDPVNFRLTSIRRKFHCEFVDRTHETSWWWETRFGRMDNNTFGGLLIPKQGGEPVAGITISALKHYCRCWNQQAFGFSQLFVCEDERGKGYAQAILVEAVRRLREEFVTLVDMHVPTENVAATAAVLSAGFERVDTGIVYRRELD